MLDVVNLNKQDAAVVENKTGAVEFGSARLAGLLLLPVVEESQMCVDAYWDCEIVGTFAETENFPLCFAVDSQIRTADECIDVVGTVVYSQNTEPESEDSLGLKIELDY